MECILLAAYCYPHPLTAPHSPCLPPSFPPQFELAFGHLYDKYRPSCYYWECILLLENFLLTLLLVMLGPVNSAALQVLVAMAVIFIEVALHVSCAGRGCRLRAEGLRFFVVTGM